MSPGEVDAGIRTGGHTLADDCAADAEAYPSHVRPVDSHRLQLGLASSHFTRRILENYQPCSLARPIATMLEATWAHNGVL